MTTHRLFFVTPSLETLRKVESELQRRGLDDNQINALSLAPEAEDPALSLHTVADLTRKDLVRSGMLGATIGSILAIGVLGATYALGWHTTVAGWMPFIFLAVVLFGFSTWEGGLFGIQTMHHQFARFENALKSGQHVFFVDAKQAQLGLVQEVADRYTTVLQPAGADRGVPDWMLSGRRQMNRFLTETLP